MEWYWIGLIALWCGGAPWGVVYALEHPDAFYKQPILTGVDIIARVFIFLFLLAFLMAAGWFIALDYGINMLQKKRVPPTGEGIALNLTPKNAFQVSMTGILFSAIVTTAIALS